MDHYVVSARKYRPATFDAVVGQAPLTAALKHAVKTGRLAHAYLFCGSRGVGKTSCARIFAKTINCMHPTESGDACGECESCRAFAENNSFNIIELDAASHNGVDDMRALTEQVLVKPTAGRYRVFIIDEVHMLTAAAFNAFLKTLEEPPEYVIFILATTEKHKIIPTILSRCQIYDFSRITIQDMVDHLARVAANEGIEAEPAALNVIARQADGAMRDALSIFDQVAASTMGHVTYASTIANLNILDSAYYGRLVEAFLAGDVPQALLIYQEVRQKGFDSQFFINGLAQYLRDLMVAQQPSTIELLEASDEVRTQMAAVAKKCKPQFLYGAMSLCNDADLNFRVATNKQFLVELTLVKLCQPLSPGPKSGAGQGLKPLQAATTATATAAASAAAAPGAAPGAVPQAQAGGAVRAASLAAHSAPVPAAPAVAPAAPSAPSAPAQPRRAGGHRLMSISISDFGAAPAATAGAAGPAMPSKPQRSEAYTPADLKRAWDDYAAAHPTERILVNTMLIASPQPGANGALTVTVDDQIQVDILMEAKQQLLDYLHERLRNDAVDFTVAVRQGPAAPVTWTDRQVLDHMLDKHPELRDLAAKFDLTL